MSDIDPFESHEILQSGVESELNVFRPDLLGVDWVAYEQRQEVLDIARVAGNTLEIIGAMSKSPQGLILNNLHGLVIEGDMPKGLEAPLAVFTGSIINGSLVKANLHGAVGTNMKMSSGSSIRFAEASDGVFPGLDLRGVDARGVRFGNTVLTGLQVDEDTMLDGASFRNAFLLNATGFTAEHLRNADFSGAFVFAAPEIEGMSLYEQLAMGFEYGQDPRKVLRSARVLPAGYVLPRISSGHDLRALYADNLRGDGAQLTERNMVGSNFLNPDIRKSMLAGSFLSGLVVTGGTFDDTDMHGIWAPGMTLEDVSLRRVDLTGANLVGSLLREVDLQGAKGLGDANTNGIVIENCILPEGFYYENGKLQSDKEKGISEQLALPE